MDDDSNQPIPAVGLLPEDQLPVGPAVGRRSEFRPHMLLRPSGFLLVLMCFALPFLTVSCDSAASAVSVTYSGYDLVTNGRPTVEGRGLRADSATDGTGGQQGDGVAGLQPLAIVIVGLLVAAAVMVSVAPGRLRLWSGAGAALVAAVLLAVNQALVHRRVVDALNQAVSKTQDQSVSIGVFNDLRLEAAKLVHTRFGFWLALALLLVLALYYGVRSATAGRGVGRLLAARIASAGGSPLPGPAPEPAPGGWARPTEPPG
jgi:hypothetical protein